MLIKFILCVFEETHLSPIEYAEITEIVTNRLLFFYSLLFLLFFLYFRENSTNRPQLKIKHKTQYIHTYVYVGIVYSLPMPIERPLAETHSMDMFMRAGSTVPHSATLLPVLPSPHSVSCL